MRSLFLVAVLALGVATPAAAAPKWMITASSKQVMVFIDANSIVRSDESKHATASMITTFASPLLGKYWGETMTVEYDCATPRYRDAANVLFTDQQGRTIYQEDPDGPEEWSPIRERTYDAATRGYVCFGEAPEGQSKDPFADSGKQLGWSKAV